MDNCLLYDWLTFSSPNYDFINIVRFLGLPSDLKWTTGLGSKLHYAQRSAFHGISIHFSEDFSNGNYNQGVCVEMSGSGCRAYETYSGRSIADLLSYLDPISFNVSRLDVAYDDFDGTIPLEIMAKQAEEFSFTSRLHRRIITNECEVTETGINGISVCHGSRESNIFIRCYDKRVERDAMNIFPHWVRFEIQLRHENAAGFISHAGTIGQKFSGLLRNYLTYRDIDFSDSNKRRWPVSAWWDNFLGVSAAISVSSKKDEDYNRDRLDSFIYGQCANAIFTSLMLDGPDIFFQKLTSTVNVHDLPTKYLKLLAEAPDVRPDLLQAFLDTIDERKKRNDSERDTVDSVLVYE